MNGTPGPNITLMKWIVIILGILIVIFTAVIVVKLYSELTGSGVEEVQSVPGPSSSGTLPVEMMTAFEDLDITLPRESRVVGIVAERGRLFVHVKNEAEETEILVIDLVGGRLAGRIRLTPSGAGK